jgi:hypothetical protein
MHVGSYTWHTDPNAAFPAAGFVNTGAAFLIGVIGSVVCSGAQELMERYGKKYITDTSEVFVCHGVSEYFLVRASCSSLQSNRVGNGSLICAV